MRLLTVSLAVALIWTASASLAVAEPTSVLLKAREGSLVLAGDEKGTSRPVQKDTLYTMYGREVKVYTYHGSTRILPQPFAWGQTRFCPPVTTWQRLPAPYLEGLIQKYALRYGVDPALVRAVMRHESGFNPNAVSPKGAQGLMQLMPGTAALMGVNNPFDPEQNIAGGVGYLRHCLDAFSHNVPLAVAAYNAGPARVARSQGVPPIRETQSFVKNVMGAYTGGSTVPLPEAKSANLPKAKTVVGPSLNNRILASPSRAAAPEAGGDKAPARPQAKIIEVRYPSGGQVVVARPAGN